MPPTPDPAPLRSAAEQVAERVAELNERIRAFWTGGRGHPAVGLTPEQRDEYHLLLAELDQAGKAKPGDVVEAA